MGKLKFEVLGIGEICAYKTKYNSIFVVEVDENGEEHLKTKMKLKGVNSCCIDDDAQKRNKKIQEKKGGALPLDEDKTVVRHADMIKCVKHGTQGPEVYAWTI